ncbi:unnamed protein product [Ambrosiozyma monospora]|uniref:Unnamed protein product n=1 Tax=Ambrosiozyma monospora TaxID=43982 RepID=A0ACB5SYR3_AMBMO|nr:unnamed protein product [Ambrosiozyma monospora]
MIGKLRVNDLTPQNSISIRKMYSLKSLTLSNCIINYNMMNNLPVNLTEINFMPSSKFDDSITANTTVKLPIHLKTMNWNFNEIKTLPKISNGDELKNFKEFQFAFFGGACNEYTHEHKLRTNQVDGGVSNKSACFPNFISEPWFTFANFQSFLNSLPSELETLSLVIYSKMCRNSNLRVKYYDYSLDDRKELTLGNFQSLENLNFHCSTMSTNLDVSIFESPLKHLNLSSPAMMFGSFPSTLKSLNINLTNYIDTFTQFWLKFITPLSKLTTFKCKFKGEETIDFRKLKIPSNLKSIELCFNSVCIILDQIPENILYFGVFDFCYDEDFGSLGSENLFEDFIISSIVVDGSKGETVESIQKQIYWFPLEALVWKKLEHRPQATGHKLQVTTQYNISQKNQEMAPSSKPSEVNPKSVHNDHSKKKKKSSTVKSFQVIRFRATGSNNQSPKSSIPSLSSNPEPIPGHETEPEPTSTSEANTISEANSNADSPIVVRDTPSPESVTATPAQTQAQAPAEAETQNQTRNQIQTKAPGESGSATPVPTNADLQPDPTRMMSMNQMPMGMVPIQIGQMGPMGMIPMPHDATSSTAVYGSPYGSNEIYWKPCFISLFYQTFQHSSEKS